MLTAWLSAAGLGVTLLRIARSHLAAPPPTGTVTHDWLFVETTSLGKVTVAQFRMVLPAGAVTVPVNVKVAPYDGGSGFEVWQATPAAVTLQFQPGWLTETVWAGTLRPETAGSCIMMATAPGVRGAEPRVGNTSGIGT